ncbi:T9SS type A sorting domain-containing protein [Flavobacterium terrigena]|uniref:Por secretion system C-terminal sorting domain-containing protein n=1 Tax=Flavobacterium terrigena TaxID=402734 RepID=A0A1H6QJK0_9FLAO|nr:T9SS type A sorting domain-containing protein [Flavobacterium terrigena]SEI43938.1 Por secretion system C-terminal sorting domain-containing protein [Flavobacterium terrigena]
MKKITLLFILILSVNSSFSQTATEYLSGLNGPTKMTVDGTTIYLNGWEDIYTIDTTAGTPSATLIYTLPANFYAYKTQKLGNSLFILVENWIESTDTFVGMQIVKLDVTNIAAGTQTVISSPNFIASIALVGNTMYFSNEIETAPDVYSTNIYSFDATQTTPTPALAYANIGLNDVPVDDVEAYNNVLYISSGGAEKIIKFDLSASSPAPVDYLNTTDLNFNKGIFITSTGYLYVTNAHEIEKIDVNNPIGTLDYVGNQTTYQDTFNGNPYLANFRDVVLIGNTLYMTLEEQGRILKITNATLGTSNFSNESIKMYPNPTTSILNLDLSNEITVNEVKIIDITGKTVIQQDQNFTQIDVEKLTTGLYIIEVYSESEKFTSKFIKK